MAETKPQSGRPLRLLVLASKPQGVAPSQRFRLEQWAPKLARDHQIRLDFSPFESSRLARILNKPGQTLEKAARVAASFIRRSSVLARAINYDGVVIHREASLIGPALYERLISLTGTPIIFDFDDAIWMHQPSSGLLSRLHFLGKTKTICRLASGVSAGNAYLAAFASQFNANVSIVPTTIELEDYPEIAEPPQERALIVCWTGSTWTQPHFEQAREALEMLAIKIPLVVKIICNEDLKRPVRGARMQFVPWSAATEAADIGNCHVGIMPLPNDPFARGKCGLKALQCMATGRPVVASPVGMNCELIRSGENGFLASTSQEYVDALLRLARSPELRVRIGRNARQTVEDSYSAEFGARHFAELTRNVIEKSGLGTRQPSRLFNR